ncbi:MAG: glycine cleavage system protein GcvH [Aeromicrobium sp.]|uniref:glycine cleavage system protein GcvH n=1 Tax=Aeromicrobium sp. TaxID=1871063 RepID=UPI0039E51A9C
MIPEDLYYSNEHEWVRLDDDIATVGITDFAQEQLGEIVYADLPQPGDSVEAGSTVGELESTKAVSDVFSPVAGEVVVSNDGLHDNYEVFGTDPYGEGWLFKVRVAPDAVEGLMSAEEYAGLITP